MKTSLLFFALITLFAFGVISAQKDSKDEVQLQGLVKRLTDAQSAFDVAALDKIFTADYIEISPAGEFDPRDKVLGFYAPSAKPEGYIAPNVSLSDFSIREYDKFAVVIVKLTFEMNVDGKTLPPRSMRATFVCRPEKGEWKIASAQFTGIRPPKQ